MSHQLQTLILAAGKGTRLKMDMPKVLAPLLGQKLIDYVIQATQQFSHEKNLPQTLCYILGHEKTQVEKHLLSNQSAGKSLSVEQKEQKGTAHAVMCAFDQSEKDLAAPYTFIICGDTPLIRAEHFSLLWDKMLKNPQLNGVVATFTTADPTGYGRVFETSSGLKIIEEKDANSDEKKQQIVNAGFYLVKTEFLKKKLKTIENKNKAQEYYLTDVFVADSTISHHCFMSSEAACFLGVNTLEQLYDCRRILQLKKNKSLLAQGVLILDALQTFIDWPVVIAANCVIHPGCHILGHTKIDNHVLLEPGCVIKNSHIQDHAEVLAYSYIDQSVVGSHAHVGPYARLRPETTLEAEVKVGNFVEVKKSKLKKGSKVSHLSYVGDASIGENSNIGCGFITCNYDGVNKHKTHIGKNVFVGSDVQMIAPIEIEDEAFIAAGSTITKSVPRESFAIARSAQVTKEGLAKKFRKPSKKETEK
jgi:bifunctional UDP-N-acetylglucosamine pyrophosphorylase/glucosamine-1-phosphate N-acetyltransferase